MSDSRVRELILLWERYGQNLEQPEIRHPELSCRLKDFLYQVRNAGSNGMPPISAWPVNLIDPDDAVMAAVEHYYLCRCWVGTGVQPAWQMRLMVDVYNIGKVLGVTPRHNPDNPTTPLTGAQSYAQTIGILHGEFDLALTGGTAPTFGPLPNYW